MSKMCKYYNELCWAGGSKCLIMSPCPRNTSSRCEIIPSKRTKTVKGWAFMGATTKQLCISSVQPWCMSVPCVAHIKAEDYKKLKGEK